MSTITNNGTGSLDIPKSRSTLTQQSKKGERVQEISRGLKQLDDQDIDEVEHRLRRSFDMETKYGPLSGLSRLERFERAQKLQLNPPIWVKAVIEAHGIDSDLNKHVFSPGKI